jgi:hypothetical protein
MMELEKDKIGDYPFGLTYFWTNAKQLIQINNKLLCTSSPSQNIRKNWSKKVDVFGQNFGLNTTILFDQFSLIFWDGRCIIYKFGKVFLKY